MHKSYSELEALLHHATTYVKVGGHYRHYKQTLGYYTVTGLCILETTDEVAVRYSSSEHPKVEFIRALAVWIEHVRHDGKMIQRFMKIA